MCQDTTVKNKQICSLCGLSSTLSLGCVVLAEFATCSAIWEGLVS